MRKVLFVFLLLGLMGTLKSHAQILTNNLSASEKELIARQVPFLFNSAYVHKALKHHLDQIAEVMLDKKHRHIVLYIKCDSNESPVSQQQVSPLIEAREKAIIDYLESKGVPRTRVKLARESRFAERPEMRDYGQTRNFSALYHIS